MSGIRARVDENALEAHGCYPRRRNQTRAGMSLLRPSMERFTLIDPGAPARTASQTLPSPDDFDWRQPRRSSD